MILCSTKKWYNKHYFIIKSPKRREIQQIFINHPSEVGLEDVVKLYRKCILKLFLILVINAIDTTFPLNYPLHFQKNLMKGVQRVIMRIGETIRSKGIWKTNKNYHRFGEWLYNLWIETINKCKYINHKWNRLKTNFQKDF